MSFEDVIDKEALDQMGTLQKMGISPLEGHKFKKEIEMVNTFLGQLPKDPNDLLPLNDPKFMRHIINEVASNLTPIGEINAIAKGGKEAYQLGEKSIKATKKYLQPGKEAEEFRAELGHGTSKENLEEISKKIKSKKESAIEESLIPKRKIYEKRGESRLFNSKKESSYLSEEGVTEPYSKKGKLINLHHEYEKNPILNTYDPLQSALKAEQRKLKKRSKVSDVAAEKYDAITKNIENLDRDASNYMKTLPKEEQELEKEFRTKYKFGVGHYLDAPSVIKKLAAGKSHELTGNQVINAFINPTEETLKVIKDMGPSLGRNLLYQALLKVPEKDAEQMAKTILKLKKTSGFDRFIGKDMEDWANKMLKRTKTVKMIEDVGKAATASAGAGMIFGPYGALIGAAVPKTAQYLSKYLKR